jgi:Zn-dependent protease
VSETAALDVTRCPDCGTELAPGLLACPGCARLVHAAELTQLAQAAEKAEQAGQLSDALASWRRATELLPAGTKQREAITARMQRLSAAVDGRAPPPKAGTGKKAGAAAGVGAVGLALLKSKALLGALLGNGKLLLVGLTKLPTLLSMLLYVRWTSGAGAGFGIGLVASIYVHEVGHVAALRRYGIAASAPMFIPGFGALVRLKQYPTDAHEEARAGLAGPLWGLVAALGALAIGRFGGLPVALSVASLGASINLFNLIPVWQLDGARGLKALSRGQRWAVAATGAVAAVATHQWLPGIIALVVFGRSFSGAHPQGDTRMMVLFTALIAALAVVPLLTAGAPLLPGSAVG